MNRIAIAAALAESVSDYVTVEEAALISRSAVATVRYWLQLGRLTKFKPGRRVLIKRDELEAFLARPAPAPKPRPHGQGGRFIKGDSAEG